MNHDPISVDFFIGNRNRFVAHFLKCSLALLFSNPKKKRTADQYYPYRHHSDFYYVTGIQQEESVLLLNPDHPEADQREILFILVPDRRMEVYDDQKLSFREASLLSGIHTVKPISALLEVIAEHVNLIQQLYIPDELFSFSDTRYNQWENIVEKTPLISEIKWIPISPFIIPMRLKKQAVELECIGKSCDITREVLDKVLYGLTPGIKEYEAGARIQYEFMKQGVQALSFEPIVAAGKNALRLHYTQMKSDCLDGDLILFDIGCEYKGYCSDYSRTVPVNGTFSSRQKVCYEAVLRVYNQIQKEYVVGNTIAAINRKALLLLGEELKQLDFITVGPLSDEVFFIQQVQSFLPHGIAHFVGLDTHDVGLNTTVLEEGMVLSCEPGLYIQAEGIGIRIETLLRITDAEPYDFFRDAPLSVSDIEGKMNKNESAWQI